MWYSRFSLQKKYRKLELWIYIYIYIYIDVYVPMHVFMYICIDIDDISGCYVKWTSKYGQGDKRVMAAHKCEGYQVYLLINEEGSQKKILEKMGQVSTVSPIFCLFIGWE